MRDNCCWWSCSDFCFLLVIVTVVVVGASVSPVAVNVFVRSDVGDGE